MKDEIILTNATIVLPDNVLRGSLVIRGPTIEAIDDGDLSTTGEDLDGDYLIPGVIDLHTDNLERQVLPRTNARWPSRSAMIAHDAQCAAAGVTTVFDALCVGDLGFDKDRVRTFREGVTDLDALTGTGLLKSDHILHLRCEIPALDLLPLLDSVIDHPAARFVSLMDHTPGVGQYADLDRYRALRRGLGDPDHLVENWIRKAQAQREEMRDPNRRAVLERVIARDIVIASHDDRLEAEIEENLRDGIQVSEFPVTMEAAQAARAHGMQVIAGAPNIVRGGSHSGNVAALTLVELGAVDALASDYVPNSLIEAAFCCAGTLPLPQAIALVTSNPARIARLDDRGRIAPGQRADLLRVRLHDGLPVVRQVWRAGERIA